ncbi:MAG: hypothetical protein PVG24_11370 [Gammaproteobacteria bacterium]|jgi:hypothetical protein
MIALGMPPGFRVETVEPDSPAEEIGLRGATLPVLLGGEEFLLGGELMHAEVELPERPLLPGDVRRFRELRSLR